MVCLFFPWQSHFLSLCLWFPSHSLEMEKPYQIIPCQCRIVLYSSFPAMWSLPLQSLTLCKAHQSQDSIKVGRTMLLLFS